jgi:hypothetical protein
VAELEIRPNPSKFLGKASTKSTSLALLRERKKIRWTDLGLVKKEKQLDERKLCSFFAKPQKQIRPVYFSSNTNLETVCLL